MSIGDPRPGARAVPPGLHFIATPIGAARDITLRALDILAAADVLAAEDTRTLRHLMEIHGVALGDRPLLPYHDHNGEAMRPRLLRALAEGKSVAYASEAGTPLVADPGFQLARAAIAAGYPVLAAPGPSAVLAALTVSGLPTDRFLFAGFPPAGAGDRAKFLAEPRAGAGDADPLRIAQARSPTVRGIARHSGTGSGGCRVPGTDQTVRRGDARLAGGACRRLRRRRDEGRNRRAGRPCRSRLPPMPSASKPPCATALAQGSVKDAAADVAAALNLPRKDVYRMALKLADRE